jgi:23S rRNA (uridine2552-2'-O)-methyltransferase
MYKQPLYVDDEIDIEIISRGEKGDGVARYDDFVIFIPNAEVKKRYTIRITKVFKSFGIGEIVNEITGE